jgi:hypothetical protein
MRSPFLAAGDKLTREEFLRRWEAEPRIKMAELIRGLVYMPSGVSVRHGDMDGRVGTWLGVYSAATPGTVSGHNATSFLLEDTPQPDLNLRVLREYGGASDVEGSYLQGTPEFVAEISRSSTSYDLHVKLDLYHKAKIPEYLAVVLFEREIRWHVLVNDRYQLVSPDADGLYHSPVFPGLWLDDQALWAGNLQHALTRLLEGIASPEHQRFVAELAARKQHRAQC